MMVTHLEKQIAHAEQSADRALNTAKGLLVDLETAQQRMAATEQNMRRTEQKLEFTGRKLELVRINANLLSSAHASAPKSTRERAVSEATAALAEIGDATNHDQSLPAIFINLARLHRASGNLDEAIDLLERFVLKADRGELVANTNVSVAYYNLACYRALKKSADLDRAMSDLEKSIRLSQNPADDMRYARGDADLDPLKEMKRFKDLLKRFNDKPPEDPVD
jgi:tetratricopeptide (TPR) repeat protein